VDRRIKQMSAKSVIGMAKVTTPAGSTKSENARSSDSLSSPVVATVRIIDANDPGSVLTDAAPGMTVIGSSLAKLGQVADVISSENGAPVAIAVSYGFLARKRKYVPGEFVDLVDDARVILSIDHNQFKLLREIGE